MDPFSDHLFSSFDEAAKPSVVNSSSSTKKRESLTNPSQSDFNSKRIRLSETSRSSEPTPQKVENPQKKDEGSSGKAPPSTSSNSNEKTKGPEEKEEEAPVICLHEVALPPKYVVSSKEIFNPPYPENPARSYKFELDPFQKFAIGSLERFESVLVSAHTSAGKTVVAEYAIAMSLRDGQRVIYTSPIKALSNQKYREFSEKFKDVGLMTGDVTINPSASCLVMTTEILRSMLYRGSEVMREVAWVVFDEIHYMRDKERGVVWEETIILLPDKVRYVFLSATIPNAKEFADWIAKIHSQPCHVVYTDFRPIPLQHYIFPAGGDGLHLVVDEKGTFREDNFQKALSVLSSSGADKSNRGGARRPKKGTSGPSDIFKIVKMIMDRNYEPVIVFSFSKKDCEALALQMSKLDFNDADEAKNVEEVFFNAIDTLSEDDKKLPQVEHILPLLKRGIGIHHSGLLPILKEVIEILFQEGLLKALFATETFSIGLNMPAKTVVFTSVRKFDGADFRWISGGEYIQMSGRAGRRGLDDRGIVILMVDEKMEPSVAKSMVKGHSDPLNSSFHLGYNMLLNLLRVEGIDPENLLKRSFHQFQSDRALPSIEKKLEDLEDEKKNLVIEDEVAVAEHYHLRQQLERCRQELRAVMNQPIHVLPFLQPGRILRVRDGEVDWGWGVVLNFIKKSQPEKNSIQTEEGLKEKYIVDVLLNCEEGSQGKPLPCPYGGKGEMLVIPVLLHLLDGLSSVRIYIPKDLRSLESRQSVSSKIQEVFRRFPDGLPLLDPIEDMQIQDKEFGKLIRKVEALENKLLSNPQFSEESMKARTVQYERKLQLDSEIRSLKKSIRSSDVVIMKDELKSMKRVLRRLGYINSENVIDMKGRVACEINAGDELLLTEMMFNSVFNDMDVHQIGALISCFVFQEKTEATIKLKDELSGPLRQLQDAARKIAKVSTEAKLPLDAEEYIQGFKPSMMDIVFAWSNGAKFIEICKMTDIFEGSIIRCMRRLEELLRQLCSASKTIGNTELENKFAQTINSIKRDIVFAVSLYL